jgi:hypothetical protein
MDKNRDFSFTIVKDETSKPFTESVCNCEFCLSVSLSNREWKGFKAKTALQKRMKRVVNKIEKRSKNKIENKINRY